MYILDDTGKVIDAECSLHIQNSICSLVIESSGGADRTAGIVRRNPEYNKLVSVLLHRLAHHGACITRVELISRRTATVPAAARVVQLGILYPVHLSHNDVEEFRKKIGRAVATMHRTPLAKGSGNAQKRLRICLDRYVDPGQLMFSTDGNPEVDGALILPSGIGNTERMQLTSARLGQGQFRSSLLKRYKERCPVTGIVNPLLLIASHIKPWCAANNYERLDPDNGLLLSAMIDRLFDRCLISFDAHGQLLASAALSLQDRLRCGLNEAQALKLSEANERYMQYHRYLFRNPRVGKDISTRVI